MKQQRLTELGACFRIEWQPIYIESLEVAF
jgi:hypothetical protein